MCGAPIAQRHVEPREERRIVTVLFADQVGFTARAESLDPEEVSAFLSPYYAHLRTELERFGGTVEKFIGDAVMALFGAPVTHEDDPERAVRAALVIRDWVRNSGGPLQLRLGVNTGEALVILDARARDGESMVAGDVVNTAARLEAAAPVNGVLVSESTYRATNNAIEYREGPRIQAKGKTSPVAVWEALCPRPRAGGDQRRQRSAPFIGRARDLELLTQSLARVRQDHSAHLVTILGAPGIGKSRLVTEFFKAVQNDAGHRTKWREGRSLPYGAEVTLWALAEVVKAEAGIFESDNPDVAERKLRAAVREVMSDQSDVHRIIHHLRPLAGLGIDAELAKTERSEAFTAWSRFFAALAERNPVVLAFDDLHWADDALLDFIEHLVESARTAPLLLVCTARPELLERRPGWGARNARATTHHLSPLSDEETSALISGLLAESLLPSATGEQVMARAGGNPLYAEQYVRMATEHRDAGDLPLPETVQGIIAARLDALPANEKLLLQGAAVVGKVFWLGTLMAIEEADRDSVLVCLASLERKGFIRRSLRSTVSEDVEAGFLHILVRDVAYGQIPRGKRAVKHRRVAEWVASHGRAENHAELLAYHCLSAIEFDRATGRGVDDAFATQAIGYLRAAGERAASLNANAGAVAYYESALDLAPQASALHAQVLFELAQARRATGQASIAELERARDELLARSDPDKAAEAETMIAELAWSHGDRETVFAHLDRAQSLVASRSDSPSKARVLDQVSRFLMLAARRAEAIEVGGEAFAMAKQLGIGEVSASSLNNIGVARIDSGDLSGIADLERSIEITAELGITRENWRARCNLAAVRWSKLGQLERGEQLWEETAREAARLGNMFWDSWVRGLRARMRYHAGRWDDALDAANSFIAEVEAGRPHYLAAASYETRAMIRVDRADTDGAMADVKRALELARSAKDPQIVLPVLASYSYVLHATGDARGAITHADEFVMYSRAGQGLMSGVVSALPVSWTLTAAGRGDAVVEALAADATPWARAAVAYAAGDAPLAAAICRDMGAVTYEAGVRLSQAEALTTNGLKLEAEAHLRHALAFYRAVGATRCIGVLEGLVS